MYGRLLAPYHINREDGTSESRVRINAQTGFSYLSTILSWTVIQL